jgi:uncharacterized Zn finger protein
MPSVADLVEPDALRERAGEYLARAGQVLRDHGAVQLGEFGPNRVTALVSDGSERSVLLAATASDLQVSCDCGNASDSGWCPHTAAVAIETWAQAPERRASR